MGSEHTVKEPGGPSSGPPTAVVDPRYLLRGAVVAIAALTALIAWLATDDGGGSPKVQTAQPPPTRIVTATGLRQATATLGQPIYWAGPVAGREIELKELSKGGVQVLYLPAGAEAGASSDTLTVGSYPLADPAGALEAVATRRGAVVRHGRGGREVVTSERSPTNVYFASPDNSVQVEVYDPSPAQAMSLALSGRVQPVD